MEFSSSYLEPIGKNQWLEVLEGPRGPIVFHAFNPKTFSLNRRVLWSDGMGGEIDRPTNLAEHVAGR